MPRGSSRGDVERGGEFGNVDALGWDDWDAEIKHTGNETRGTVTLLWMALVAASSMYAWSFVNVRKFLEDLFRFAKQHWLVGGAAQLTLLVAVLILISIYWYAIFHAFSMLSYLGQYHEVRARVPRAKRRRHCQYGFRSHGDFPR